jgi:hypothetical protein
MGFFRPPDIDKMIKNNDIDGLLKALEHNDENIRYKAAIGLATVGDGRAIEQLIVIISDKSRDSGVRKSAILCLIALRDERAVLPLTEALKDSSIRDSAALALAAIGGDEVVDLLNTALNDKEFRYGYLDIYPALKYIGSPQAIDALISFIDSKTHPDDCREVVKALLDMSCVKAAFPIFKHCCNDASINGFSMQDFKSLGKKGEAQLLKSLESLLKSKQTEFEIHFYIVRIAFYFYWYYSDSSDKRNREMAITALSLVKKHGTDEMMRDIRSEIGSHAVYGHGAGAEVVPETNFDIFISGLPD